jgi:hypothetical protein
MDENGKPKKKLSKLRLKSMDLTSMSTIKGGNSYSFSASASLSVSAAVEVDVEIESETEYIYY